jgi:SAM-dependent methyltransferase
MCPKAIKIRKAISHPGLAYKILVQKAKRMLLWDYYYSSLREPKTRIKLPLQPDVNDIVDKLKGSGINVSDFAIDIADYHSYLQKAEYQNFQNYYGGGKAKNFFEKSLEHYLAAKVLNLSSDDVYIDIASENSPSAEIYKKLYGCQTYRQDLMFPKGFKGNTIGGDACYMPVPNAFASRMALHCSFEHFEQDADIRFVKEANRVLADGGKLCIVPLYLYNQYGILTNPVVLPRGGISFDSDAMLFCCKSWGERHGRFYDVSHLISRVLNNINFRSTIFVVQNEHEVDRSCYAKFIAVFEKLGN